MSRQRGSNAPVCSFGAGLVASGMGRSFGAEFRMHLRLITILGLEVAVGSAVGAATSPGYLHTQGTSAIRFAGPKPTALARPTLPPLPWGDEADQPPAPRQVSLTAPAGAPASSPDLPPPRTASGTAASSHLPTAPPIGEESSATQPAGEPATGEPSNPALPASAGDEPVGPTPFAPGMLVPFFTQPVAAPAAVRSNVVVPLQFTPAPPPVFRSSTATFTKE